MDPDSPPRRSRRDVEEQSATKLGAAARGSSTRARKRKDVNAATRVQAVTRGHLTRQNSKMMSVDLPALVNLWLDAGFEMIAWDFDRTVLRVHAYARGVKVEEVPSRLEKDVADLDPKPLTQLCRCQHSRVFFGAQVVAANLIQFRVSIVTLVQQIVPAFLISISGLRH